MADNKLFWAAILGAAAYLTFRDKKGFEKTAEHARSTGLRIGTKIKPSSARFAPHKVVTVKDEYGTMRARILPDLAPAGQVRVEDLESGNRWYVQKSSIV